jgi:hypothetical protein
MAQRSSISIIVAVALATFALPMFLHAQTRGQTPAPARPGTANVPRMPDGKPNFTGLWQVLGTADWDIRDHGAQPGPCGARNC